MIFVESLEVKKGEGRAEDDNKNNKSEWVVKNLNL